MPSGHLLQKSNPSLDIDRIVFQLPVPNWLKTNSRLQHGYHQIQGQLLSRHLSRLPFADEIPTNLTDQKYARLSYIPALTGATLPCVRQDNYQLKQLIYLFAAPL